MARRSSKDRGIVESLLLISLLAKTPDERMAAEESCSIQATRREAYKRKLEASLGRPVKIASLSKSE
jgi:hypothetical protein